MPAHTVHHVPIPCDPLRTACSNNPEYRLSSAKINQTYMFCTKHQLKSLITGSHKHSHKPSKLSHVVRYTQLSTCISPVDLLKCKWHYRALAYGTLISDKYCAELSDRYCAEPSQMFGPNRKILLSLMVLDVRYFTWPRMSSCCLKLNIQGTAKPHFVPSKNTSIVV